MIAHNPVIRSVAVVLLFWYLVLYVVAIANGVKPWTILVYLPQSLLVALVGGIGGLGLAVMARAGLRSVTEDEIRNGSRIGDAVISMGSGPSLPAPRRKSFPVAQLNAHPWWALVQANSPAHAAAIKAVLDTMYALPRLPASPYPGGHAGRSLIEHSLAVVPFMLKHAKHWEYKGQVDKRGKVRVPLQNPEEPHRFAGGDAPLLILAAIAHDIGKMTCYVPNPGQNPDATTGALLLVTEARPMHDTEGAKILRKIPEIMALPQADRTALIAAVGYYHHPFGLPISGWVTDRVRSLTELLAVADIETGKSEGHVLTGSPADADDDFDTDQASATITTETARALGVDVDAEDDADGELLRKADAVAAKAAPRSQRNDASTNAPSATKVAANAPFELRLFMDVIRQSGAINGKHPSSRIAWKHSGVIYVMDEPMRNKIKTAGGITSDWAATALAPASGNMAPYTQKLIEQLDQIGGAIRTWNGMTFTPARALFRAEGVPPVFMVQASAVPGAEAIPDCERPINIQTPFWGSISAAGKDKGTGRAVAPDSIPVAPMPAGDAMATPDPEGVVEGGDAPAVDDGIDAPFDQLDGLPLSQLDESDFPAGVLFPEPPKPPESPDVAVTAGAAPADSAAALLRDLVMEPAFREAHPFECRDKPDGIYAVIPLSSSAGQRVTEAVEALQSGGFATTDVQVAKLADSGELAYIFLTQAK